MQGLLRISAPAISPEVQDWSATKPGTVVLALNLVPFTGIAFFMVHRRVVGPAFYITL